MRGHTFIELVIVLGLLALSAAIAIPPASRLLDRAAVDEAADRYAALHEVARQLALARGRLVRLELDTAARTVTLAERIPGTRWDTLRASPLGSARVATGQPVITFSPIGVGFGLSNSTIVFSRGAAAETLTVARTGRLKRG